LGYLVKKYSKEDKQVWNGFISEAKNATFLFDRDFMDYHSDRFEDYSLLIYKNEKLIALLPTNSVKEKVFSHKGLSYGGFILGKRISFKDTIDVIKETLSYLASQNIVSLELKLMPRMYLKSSCDDIDYALFKLKATLTRRDISMTRDNLNPLPIISSNRKRGIKKGLKNNLIIKEETDFKGFWNDVLSPNLRKNHNVDPVHSLQEIQHLKHHFPSKIRQFNVYNDRFIVAGVTIFETDMVAHAQYISANTEGQQLGSLDVLFEHLLNTIFNRKKYFDFGISNENKGQQVNLGLLTWKESFGTIPILHEFYDIPTANYELLNDLFL